MSLGLDADELRPCKACGKMTDGSVCDGFCADTLARQREETHSADNAVSVVLSKILADAETHEGRLREIMQAQYLKEPGLRIHQVMAEITTFDCTVLAPMRVLLQELEDR